MAPQVLKKRKLEHSPVLDEHEEGIEDSTAGSDNDSEEVDTGIAGMERISNGTRRPRDQSSKAPSFPQAGEYNTDMLQMQIGELLEEVRPKYETRMAKVEKALHKLKHAIESIPAREPLSIVEAERNLFDEHQIAVPFPEPRPSKDLQYKLSYEKPSNINVVGSFALRTAVKGEEPLVIDLAVTIPSTLFQEKDYMNHRYFYKRAYYVACLAGGIRKSTECHHKLEYEYQDSNPLQPVLLVSPVKDGGEDDFSSCKAQIRIVPATSHDLFPIAKTLPWKSSVRAKSIGDTSSTPSASLTPLYNATLRSESSVSSYLKLLHAASVQCEGFKNACMLWTVWLKQRGFESDLRRGGFGWLESSSLLALLLRGGGPNGRPLLSTGYSSYQLFKASLQFVASRDLVHEPIIMYYERKDDIKFFKSNTPMFYDGERGINILYKMLPWSYRALRNEARRTLDILGTTLFDRFTPSFITKLDDDARQFDIIVRLRVPASSRPASDSLDTNDRVLDFCKKAYKVLTTGLGNRVNSVHFKAPQLNPWSLDAEGNPAAQVPDMVNIGLLVNPENISRSVDHGPPAEDKKAAAAFRKFWGEKAELRRFKDGSILESLIWTVTRGGDSVMHQIINYVIARHLGTEAADSISYVADDFYRMLPGRQSHSLPSLLPFEPSNTGFETLAKQIRELEGLPLQIRQISASSASLRYASIIPPEPGTNDGSSQPMDMLIQFEGSARWPDDIAAIQRTKIAFLLKLGDLLEKATPGTITRLGLENTSQKLLNTSFLDITTPNSLSYRLRIHHDRELTLLTRDLKTASTAHIRETTAHAISTYKRTFLHSPAHTTAVRTLSTRFPLLSPTIRLLKHWASCHLLSLHLSSELLELLVLRAFLHPAPWPVPGSLRTAFLRTMTFIAKWNWRSEPLIVDLGGEMTDKDVEAINTRFDAWRKIDPALNRTVLFAGTNLDPDGLAWTERGPSKVVAARLTSLAAAACGLVKERGVDVDVEALFTASLQDYDFVIRLSDKARGGRKTKKSMFKNLRVEGAMDVELVGFDPVLLFVEELLRIHGPNIVFFCGEGERSVITGLWSPSTGPRAWKVGLTCSTVPIHKGDEENEESMQVEINKTAILNNIARLGGDLVSKIEVKH